MRMTEDVTLRELPLNLDSVKDPKQVRSVDISYAPDLEELSPLQILTELESLTINVGHGAFPDLSPLQPLSKLRFLQIYCFNRQTWEDGPTPASDHLKSLAGLQQLTTLRLSSGAGKDGVSLEPLAQLTALKELSLSFSALDYQAPKIDFSPLSALTELEQFSTSFNKNHGFSFLSDLPKLKTIDLRLDEDDDLSSLEEALTLEELTLQGPFKSLPSLGKLDHLRTLTLTDGCTSLEDIGGLRGLRGLTSLTLNITKDMDLSPLRELTSLETLQLRNGAYESCKLEIDSAVLEPLKALKDLGIVGVRALDLRPIGTLPALEKLYLGGCHSANFEALLSLKKLRELILKNSSRPDKELLAKIRRAHPQLKYQGYDVDPWGN